MTPRKWMIVALLAGLAVPVWAEDSVAIPPDGVTMPRPMLSQAQREKMRALSPAQRQEYMQALRKARRAECLNARIKERPVRRHGQGMGVQGGNGPAIGK